MKSATASALGFSVSVSAMLQQTSSVTAANITLSADSLTRTSGTVDMGGSSDTANNLFDLTFDLTVQSLVHLTGSLGTFSICVAVGHCSGTSQLLLTGPGFHFQPTPGVPSSSPFDLLVMLDPGTYDLSATADSGIETGGCCFTGSVQSDAFVRLNVDFTAIPEPRGTTLVLALLLIVSRGVARRYHPV
jgi:hypothetical protein